MAFKISINGFRPAVTHPSCSALLLARLPHLVTPIDNMASSIWSFQRKRSRPIRWLRQISVSFSFDSPAHSLPFERHGRSYSAAERQLALNPRCYVGLFTGIPSRRLHQCLIVSMPWHHKEALRWLVPCKVLYLSYERGICYSIAYCDHSSTSWQHFWLYHQWSR